MTKDQFIFEKLEMGRWHTWEYLKVETGITKFFCSCGKNLSYQHDNPDFTTWEGCGRLLDYLQTDPRAEYLCEMLRTEQSLCCLHEEHIPLSQLKPVIIRNKLADFLGWEGE